MSTKSNNRHKVGDRAVVLVDRHEFKDQFERGEDYTVVPITSDLDGDGANAIVLNKDFKKLPSDLLCVEYLGEIRLSGITDPTWRLIEENET